MGDIGISVWKSWPEIIGLLLLIIGFVVALSISSIWISYTIIFLAGLLAGRVIYKKKGNQPLFPFMLIIIIFLVGYLLGSFMFNRVLLLVTFIISIVLSYKIHKEKYI